MKTSLEDFPSKVKNRLSRAAVRALAGGAILVAAALPFAAGTGAQAATPTSLTGFCFTQALATATGSCLGLPGVGQGSSIYVLVSEATVGTPFAYDGANNVTLTTTAPGVTFLQVKEVSSSELQAAIVTTGASTPGTYPVTVTDDNGTFTSTSAATTELTIDAAPTVTAVSPTSIPATQTAAVTITGTGFDCLAYGAPSCAFGGAASEPSVTFLNATTGVPLTTGSVAVTGASSKVSGTTITLNVTGTNSVNGASAPAGSYNLTILNPDQGTVTFPNALTISAAGVTSISPSALAATASHVPVIITGAGFQQGATVTFGGAGCTTPPTVDSGTTVVASSNTIDVTLSTAAATGPCNVIVTNTSPGNGAVLTGTAILGIGAAGDSVPTITAATLSPAAPIVPGSSTSVTETITGLGFSSYSTVKAIEASGSTDNHLGFACTSSSTGTTLTCTVTGGAGSAAGTDSLVVTNATGYASSAYANALTVAGPAITSVAPTAISAGAPIGTTLTFTGTGFNSTASATFSTGTAATSLSGLAYFAVTSPTTATLALTSTLGAAEVGTQNIAVSEYNSSGTQVVSSAFTFTVNASPTVTGITYPTTDTTNNIGTGAVSFPVTITGTNFLTGATITKFTNYYNVADTLVTATVTSVTASAIKATITVPATEANLAVGYTVTDTDGGTVTVAANGTGAISIVTGPTITAVTPATATAGTAQTFTITGTGFVSGATVATSPTNGTCSSTTFTSSTTLSLTCTFGVAGTTAVSLVVTNPNGGSATSAPVLAAATAPAPVSPFTTGASGTAKVGKTSTIVVSGGGFYAQPTVTSSAGIKAVVSGDTGTALTVRVTVSKNVPGEHTLTFTLANGSVFKVNFKVTK